MDIEQNVKDALERARGSTNPAHRSKELGLDLAQLLRRIIATEKKRWESPEGETTEAKNLRFQEELRKRDSYIALLKDELKFNMFISYNPDSCTYSLDMNTMNAFLEGAMFESITNFDRPVYNDEDYEMEEN